MQSKLTLLIFMFANITAMAGCADKNSISPLKPVEFGKMIESSPETALLDVRTPEEYATGYIPGAVNIDAQAPEFIAEVQARFPTSQPLALYCRSGRRSAEAATRLKSEGYDVSDLDGGIMAWEESLLPVTTGPTDLYYTKGGVEVVIQPLIHASIRIIADGKEIEIDPVTKLGDRTTDYTQFPPADVILVTHEHHDHLDPEAIKTLSKTDTTVIANPRSVEILGFGKALKNGDTLHVDSDITIEAVPAYNTSPERLQFHPQGRDNGYILTLAGIRIYVAGDTEVIPEMENFKDIDIAFLPCNLPYTMTPDQFIEAAKIIRPRVVYPYHYGDTDLSSITTALAADGIYVRICPFDP